MLAITEVREIDETVNRNPNTRGTSVFHGRDLFGYCAARLASGIITYEQVGPAYDVSEIVCLPMAEPALEDGCATGIVDIIDPNFGNAWTNIPQELLQQAGIDYGDVLHVVIRHGQELVLDERMPLCRAFGEVGKGELLAYTNELMNVSVTMNFGGDWTVAIER